MSVPDVLQILGNAALRLLVLRGVVRATLAIQATKHVCLGRTDRGGDAHESCPALDLLMGQRADAHGAVPPVGEFLEPLPEIPDQFGRPHQIVLGETGFPILSQFPRVVVPSELGSGSED